MDDPLSRMKRRKLVPMTPPNHPSKMGTIGSGTAEIDIDDDSQNRVMNYDPTANMATEGRPSPMTTTTPQTAPANHNTNFNNRGKNNSFDSTHPSTPPGRVFIERHPRLRRMHGMRHQPRRGSVSGIHVAGHQPPRTGGGRSRRKFIVPYRPSTGLFKELTSTSPRRSPTHGLNGHQNSTKGETKRSSTFPQLTFHREPVVPISVTARLSSAMSACSVSKSGSVSLPSSPFLSAQEPAAPTEPASCTLSPLSTSAFSPLTSSAFSPLSTSAFSPLSASAFSPVSTSSRPSRSILRRTPAATLASFCKKTSNTSDSAIFRPTRTNKESSSTTCTPPPPLLCARTSFTTNVSAASKAKKCDDGIGSQGNNESNNGNNPMMSAMDLRLRIVRPSVRHPEFKKAGLKARGC